MTLYEKIEADINKVFLNEDEFAAKRLIDRKEVVCVISTEDGLPIVGGYALGVASSTMQIFCSIHDLDRKEPGQNLNIDGAEYIIDKWSHQMGMHVITISQTTGV